MQKIKKDSLFHIIEMANSENTAPFTNAIRSTHPFSTPEVNKYFSGVEIDATFHYKGQQTDIVEFLTELYQPILDSIPPEHFRTDLDFSKLFISVTVRVKHPSLLNRTSLTEIDSGLIIIPNKRRMQEKVLTSMINLKDDFNQHEPKLAVVKFEYAHINLICSRHWKIDEDDIDNGDLFQEETDSENGSVYEELMEEINSRLISNEGLDDLPGFRN